MTWRSAEELTTEVATEADLEAARKMLAREPWPEKELKRLSKDYEERKHRAHTLPSLIVPLVELKAEWRFLNFGFQFRFPGNYILCWWPRTEAILWQGAGVTLPTPQSVAEALDAYARADKQPSPPPARAPAPVDSTPCLVCLVCGEPKAEKRCPKCDEIPELCEPCWSHAHWCPTENR